MARKKKSKSYNCFSFFLIALFIVVLLATALVTSSLEKTPVARETATTGAVALVVQPPVGGTSLPAQEGAEGGTENER